MRFDVDQAGGLSKAENDELKVKNSNDAALASQLEVDQSAYDRIHEEHANTLER